MLNELKQDGTHVMSSHTFIKVKTVQSLHIIKLVSVHKLVTIAALTLLKRRCKTKK